jgi:outer membrane lipoprotein SlyB
VLYPLLVSAAIAVIIFSALGIATMTGLLPRAESSVQRAAPAEPLGVQQPGVQQSCESCGVVESVTPVRVRGQGSGLGLVAGGVAGALLGNQIGRGTGNAVATIAGAAGGAYAGNEIEKNSKASVRYKVRVRMDDGTYRTVSEPHAPPFGAGDKVKIANGRLAATR